ncbi:hypothetical protein Tco_1556356 [Tanacetum coccineum]
MNNPPEKQTIDNDMKYSLKIFMRVKVLIMRVEDFQIRIESFKFKLNYKIPLLTFLKIEDMEPYRSSEYLSLGLFMRMESSRRVEPKVPGGGGGNLNLPEGVAEEDGLVEVEHESGMFFHNWFDHAIKELAIEVRDDCEEAKIKVKNLED